MFFFCFKQKTAYDLEYGLVGSEMCIRDRSGCTSLNSRPGTALPVLGKAVPGFELKVVHPDSYEELPERHVGELLLRGTSVTPGYYKRLDATAALFRDACLCTCLLYASDAADALLRVDLVGRPMLKKRGGTFCKIKKSRCNPRASRKGVPPLILVV